MKRIVTPNQSVFVLVATVWFFLSACSGTHRSEPQCAVSEAAIGGAAQRLVASDNARDLAGVLAGYTDDVIWLPPTGDILNGKAAIRPRYEKLFSSFNINMSSEVVEARAEGGLGFARGFTKGTLTPLGGGTPTLVDDKFVALVRCEAGVWRVSHLMWSPRSKAP